MTLRALVRDEAGAVAVVVAVMLPLLLGAGAFAVDASYYRLVRNQLQSAADAAALSGVQSLDEPAAAIAAAVDFAQRNVPEGFGNVTSAGDVEVGAYDPVTRAFAPATENINALRVVAAREPERGNAPRRFLGLIFGEAFVSVRASAIAARSVHSQYEAPVVTALAPEAGDFNEVYVYCFDYQGAAPAAERRSQMTLIANNDPAIVTKSGGVISQVPGAYVWPRCGKGESLSFRMRNIRHAKSLTDLWADPSRRPGRPEHNYFTDTELVGGVEQFRTGWDILETVRCETLSECVGTDRGGVVPVGRRRAPQVETRPCMPGKFMYFGWEDRPPGQSGASGSWTDPAWTDRDYDDIRFVMACPEGGMLGYGLARLVE